jgi:hypothetical protein
MYGAEVSKPCTWNWKTLRTAHVRRIQHANPALARRQHKTGCTTAFCPEIPKPLSVWAGRCLVRAQKMGWTSVKCLRLRSAHSRFYLGCAAYPFNDGVAYSEHRFGPASVTAAGRLNQWNRLLLEFRSWVTEYWIRIQCTIKKKVITSRCHKLNNSTTPSDIGCRSVGRWQVATDLSLHILSISLCSCLVLIPVCRSNSLSWTGLPPFSSATPWKGAFAVKRGLPPVAETPHSSVISSVVLVLVPVTFFHSIFAECTVNCWHFFCLSLWGTDRIIAGGHWKRSGPSDIMKIFSTRIGAYRESTCRLGLYEHSSALSGEPALWTLESLKRSNLSHSERWLFIYCTM